MGFWHRRAILLGATFLFGLACSANDPAVATSQPAGTTTQGTDGASTAGGATSGSATTTGAATETTATNSSAGGGSQGTSATSTAVTTGIGTEGMGGLSSTVTNSSVGGTFATSVGGAAGAGGSSSTGGPAGGAGGGGSTSEPCPGSAVLCEDFEDTTPGGVPSGWSSEGNAAVTQEDAFRGVQALKLGQAENGPRRINRSAGDLGMEHWGRIFYRVELPVPQAFVHSTFVALSGNSSEYRMVDTVKNEQGQHQFLYNIQPQGNEWGCGSSYDYAFDGEWHCAEWQVSSVSQSYHFYYDGVEIESIGVESGSPRSSGCGDPPSIPTTFEEVRVGIYNYQQAPPGFVLFIDDLAIASERVGCE